MLTHFHTIAFTHRNLDVSAIGKLHIEAENQQDRFNPVKDQLNIDELLFLSTCNRVEFLLVGPQVASIDFLTTFFKQLYPEFTGEAVDFYVANATVVSNIEAIDHLLRVASSIDSLVIGEREIITQVRQAYDSAHKNGFSGDFIRLLIKHVIQTAKRVYTETKISLKPVSVVSIAYQRLQGMDVPSDARVLVVGAGVTNTAMCRFLKKHGMSSFVVFNRTLSKAQALADELGGKAFPLDELAGYKGGFDILVTCTGSEDAIITPEIYSALLQGDTTPKVTIDLALPNDIHSAVHKEFQTRQISINVLQTISDNHLQERSQEIEHVEAILSEAIESFHHILKLRRIEIAMRPVPQMVKDIKATAFNDVFKNELENMDADSKELLEKIVGYMEKKYMSMPMKMAKEILIKH
ncbi:MAG TPA: glutamyl-tRNA reductase [Fluviicola sp.]|nr:glutamyl-tRNA reductase [Fluviicola sp.]